MHRIIILTCFLLLLSFPLCAFSLNQLDSCGNTDVCGNGLKCVANICVLDASTDGVNGLANSCSFNDCCPGTTLICASIVKRCVMNDQSAAGLATEGCQATGVAPSNSVVDIGQGTGMETTSTGVISIETGNGTFSVGGQCGNQVNCANGLMCYANVCVTGVAGGALDGYGNQCSSTDCCKTGLVCLAAAKICSPTIPGLQTLTCTANGGTTTTTGTTISGTTGTTTTTTGTTGTTTPVSTTTGVVVSSTCSNTDTCPSGEKCVANFCVSGTSTSVPDGMGNKCSASNCCKSGLVCVTGINVCSTAITSSFLPIIACTNSGSIITSTTGANGGLITGSTINGNHAPQAVHVSMDGMLILVITAIATIVYN